MVHTMTTDREMLELAAKAAGVESAICYDAYPEDGFPTAYAKVGKGKYWNPLTDDGDALRLAVKLSMRISIGDAGVMAYYDGVKYAFDSCYLEYHSDGRQTKAEATRRCIVSAAAEIGRGMP